MPQVSLDSEPAYMKWFALLQTLPPLHAIKVKNDSIAVNKNLTLLTRLGHIKPREFKFRRLKEENACLIFHNSTENLGRLIKPGKIRYRYHDWSTIKDSVPPGFGVEMKVEYETARGALWRDEGRGVINRGEYRIIRLGPRRNNRCILYHSKATKAHTKADTPLPDLPQYNGT